MVGDHASARVRPSRPMTCRITDMSVTWNPVPRMIVSTACVAAVRAHHGVRADLGDGLGHHVDVGRLSAGR